MRVRNRNKATFKVEMLESRLALSAFGAAVSAQAHDPETLDGTATFGEHQSDYARDLVATDGVKGLGQYNNAKDGFAKVLLT